MSRIYRLMVKCAVKPEAILILKVVICELFWVKLSVNFFGCEVSGGILLRVVKKCN